MHLELKHVQQIYLDILTYKYLLLVLIERKGYWKKLESNIYTIFNYLNTK